MLRTLGVNRPQRSLARIASFAIVAMVGLAVAGLRGPGGESGSVALAQVPPPQDERAPAERLSLELVPKDPLFVVSIRPAEIVGREEFRELIRFFDEMVLSLKQSQLSLRDIREVMAIQHGGQSFAEVRLIIRFKDSGHQTQFLEEGSRLGVIVEQPNSDGWKMDGNKFVREIDTSTLVIDENFASVLDIPPLKNAMPRWAEAWQERNDRPLVFGLDVKSVVKQVFVPPLDPGGLPGGFALQAVAPVVMETDWIVGGIELKEHLHLSALLKSSTEESAKHVRDTLEALAVLLQNSLRTQAKAVAEQRAFATPELAKAIEETSQIVANSKITAEGEQVRLSLQSQLTMPEIARFATAMLPAIEEAQQAAKRTQSINNLRQLALAMHNYHDVNGSFPPAVSYTYRTEVVGGEERTSEHPHSWRVALLPFFEHGPRDLYEQYRFDEPWDSEANMKVLEQMPDAFRSPHDEPSSTNTSFFVLTGPGAIFDGEERTQFREVTDGTVQTLLLVEAKRPVSWTKPEDIPYAADGPVPKLGGWIDGEFLAATADSAVHRVSADVDEATLRAFITKAGMEIGLELPKPKGAR